MTAVVILAALPLFHQQQGSHKGLAPDGQLICHFEVVLVLGVGDAPYIRLLDRQEGLIGKYLLVEPPLLLICHLHAKFNLTKCHVPPL